MTRHVLGHHAILVNGDPGLPSLLHSRATGQPCHSGEWGTLQITFSAVEQTTSQPHVFHKGDTGWPNSSAAEHSASPNSSVSRAICLPCHRGKWGTIPDTCTNRAAAALTLLHQQLSTWLPHHLDTGTA
uniref:Uncharacterized protein n=1 Tax=Myotis myotis TaxID=51298 RepID=A0A7J7YDV6_MYOMY|nr:hypothetical protein mMyoMyo1_011081 [Myotis myotis]